MHDCPCVCAAAPVSAKLPLCVFNCPLYFMCEGLSLHLAHTRLPVHTTRPEITGMIHRMPVVAHRCCMRASSEGIQAVTIFASVVCDLNFEFGGHECWHVRFGGSDLGAWGGNGNEKNSSDCSHGSLPHWAHCTALPNMLPGVLQISPCSLLTSPFSRHCLLLLLVFPFERILLATPSFCCLTPLPAAGCSVSVY